MVQDITSSPRLSWDPAGAFGGERVWHIYIYIYIICVSRHLYAFPDTYMCFLHLYAFPDTLYASPDTLRTQEAPRSDTPARSRSAGLTFGDLGN